MNKLFLLMAVLVISLTGSLPCLALMSIGNVSKEQAGELGIEIRSKPAGPEAVWVELEFKTDGKLKNFSHVSLEIGEGGEVLVGYAPLREERSGSGSVVIRFLAHRAYLDKITLRVVVGVPMDRVGYDIRLKEFVDPEKVHTSASSAPQPVTDETSAVQGEARLEFLANVPAFHDFDLTMTEAQLVAISTRNKLGVQVSSEGDRKTYRVWNQYGENVIVGFRDGKCTGIQRMRKDPSLTNTGE